MAVLIDTGLPGQIDDLRVAMEKVEVSFDKPKSCDLDASGCGSYLE
ncbi:hypothetical protein SAM19_04412 [Brevibacillus laterosporus]|nr:hypothetical protein [Brevibacillus laterosporus]